MEIDKRRKTVLRTVILVAVVLAAAGIILLIFRLADTKVDTGKGLERLAALEKYNGLDQMHVLAERGAGVVNGEGKMAASQIAQAKSLVPQTLFLAYGMNDMKVTDQESFLAAYRGILEDLKQSLPDTDIYVNCILPVRQQTAETELAYANISQYNEGLKSLCEGLKVTFIDNADLVKEEYYADDGIHMAPAYYTEWVNRMAEVAGL